MPEPAFAAGTNVGSCGDATWGRAYSFEMTPPTNSGCVAGTGAAGCVVPGRPVSLANTTAASNSTAQAAATPNAANARTTFSRLCIFHLVFREARKGGANGVRPSVHWPGDDFQWDPE